MNALQGVVSAVLTPFDDAYRPDAAAAVPYYQRLLEEGCDGLNVLGTTGEAMSVGLRQRLKFMERIASALPAQRLMTGTGASALDDAAELTRAALDLGFTAALVIPPFYYREAAHDRIVAFFDALFERVRPPARSIMLYNFPRMSGTTFEPALVERLTLAFPGIIRGVKDSSNSAALEEDIHTRCADLDVYPGSESLLATARARGMAGCISGSVCLWPQLAQRAWTEGREEDLAELVRLRAGLEGAPLIAAVRARVAAAEGSERWHRGIPPL